ncbi:c-type cytochrome, partial [Pseudomonas aeruginosa]
MKNKTRPQDKVAGRGVGKDDPALKPNPKNGRKVYARQCAVCHGENDEERRKCADEMIFPPLWGDESINIGPGIARTFTDAAFV